MRTPFIFTLLVFACHALIAQSTPSAQAIGQRTYKFIDPTRSRPVTTEVWYPTTDTVTAADRIPIPFARQYTVRNGRLPASRLPLILLSHGTGGGRLTLEWLVQPLVRQGFIVAAVDHWGNTYDNPIPLEFVKPWERPLDISFALTSLLKDDAISAVIDQKRIGAMGFSFGGYTVIALAGGVVDYPTLINFYKTVGHKELEIPEFPGLVRYLDDSSLVAAVKHIPNLKDDRIQSFFAISPALGGGFTSKKQFSRVDRPIYIIGSQSDSMAPVSTNARHFHTLIGHSAYYEFPGRTGHYVMLGEATDDLKKAYATFFTDDASVDRRAVHLRVDSLTATFFTSTLKE